MPKVQVVPERVTVRPGEGTEVEVTIQNTGRSVEHYDTTVVGLPRDDLYGCVPPTVKLRPGESGTVTVNLRVPVRAAAGTDLSSEKLVTFTQRPRIPGGPLRFVGIALAVGVLATATLAGALMRNAADSKPGAAQSQPAATGVAAGPPLQIVTSAP